jgi:hypothetical protein
LDLSAPQVGFINTPSWIYQHPELDLSAPQVGFTSSHVGFFTNQVGFILFFT